MAEFPDDIGAIGRALINADAILVNKTKATMADVLNYVQSGSSGLWADGSPTIASGGGLVSDISFAGGRYAIADNVVTCSGQLDVTTTGAGLVLALVAAPVPFSIVSPVGRGGAAAVDANAAIAGSAPIVGLALPYPSASPPVGAIGVVFASAGAADLSFVFTLQFGVTA